MNLDLRAIFDSPYRCAALIGGLLLLLLPGLFRLEITGSTESMFPKDVKVVKWGREFSANFRSNPPLVIVVRAENIFAPETLRHIRDLASELETLEVVTKVENLFSIEFPGNEPGGFRLRPLIGEIPETADEVEKLRREILRNPVLRNSLVNESGTAAALYPALNRRVKVPDYQRYVVETLQESVASARERGIDAYLAGGPVLANAIEGNIWRDLKVLGSISLLVVTLMILLFFRWRTALFFNFFTSILSVTATLGFMGLAGIEVTALVSIVVILIVIIGCTEDIHLLAEFVLELEDGKTGAAAFRSMRHTVFSALFVTAMSTSLGFFVTAISPVPALRDFAVACGTGILLNFVITILLAPVFLRKGKRTLTPVIPSWASSSFLHEWCVGAAGRYAAVSRVGAVSLVILAAVGLSRITVDNNFLHFFAKHSAVRQSQEKLNEDFGGSDPLVVTIDTHQKEGVWQPDAIERIREFHDRLDEAFFSVSGLTGFLREYLYQIGEASHREPGDLTLTGNQIAECRAAFGNRFLKRYIDYDGSRTAISVRSSLDGSRDIRFAQELINRIAKELFPPHWDVRILGEPVETAVISDSVTGELIRSLFLLSVVVSAILIFYFRSWKLGLIVMVPNLFPVLATFGFMGWVGIPMGTGIFAVAMAAFGIAVDDTIHLVVRFRHEFKEAPGRPFSETLRKVFARELFPLLATSITLILGFSVLLLSDFQMHRETGLLFMVAISAAMVADLFLTPLILKRLHCWECDRCAADAVSS